MTDLGRDPVTCPRCTWAGESATPEGRAVILEHHQRRAHPEQATR
jgi:hypothetical protein